MTTAENEDRLLTEEQGKEETTTTMTMTDAETTMIVGGKKITTGEVEVHHPEEMSIAEAAVHLPEEKTNSDEVLPLEEMTSIIDRLPEETKTIVEDPDVAVQVHHHHLVLAMTPTVLE